jgi:hypothetical protein
MMLFNCTDEAMVGKARQEMALLLISKDRRLRRLGVGDDKAAKNKSAVLAVARILAKLQLRLGQPGKGKTDGKDDSTSYVVTQSEEERGFTIPSYDSDDVNRNRAVLQKMMNLRLRPFSLPSIGGFKKIAYWVKREVCWPDPARVPLSVMRREPTDSALTLFKRMAFGVVVVAAGEKVTAGTRDEGAGDMPKSGVQWASGLIIEDLVAELMELENKMEDGQMAAVTAVMHDSLHRATLSGKESVSLAAQRQISKVGEHVAASSKGTGAGVQRETGKKKKRKGGDIAPPKKKPPKVNLSAAGGGAGGGAGGYLGQNKDAEGELGPNQLPRKKGGNPDGLACKKFAQNGKCDFHTCSYSHTT